MYNILIQSDQNYVVYSAVTLASLFDNNKEAKFKVYYIADDISDDSKDKLSELAIKYNNEISFIDPAPIKEWLTSINASKYRNSYAVYYKIFMEKYLPQDIDKILFLDADLAIVGNISELYNTDLTDNVLGMCLDTTCCFTRLINKNEPHLWYNVGVMLFNYKKWRDDNCEERIICHMLNVGACYPAPEQDLINLLFRYNVKTLDMRYNYGAGFEVLGHEMSQKIYEWFPIIREQMDEAVKDVCVYHCFPVFGRRPWDKDAVYPERMRWDYYLSLTPWKDYVKTDSKNLDTAKKQYFLYKHCPSFIYAKIHNYFFKKEIKTMINRCGMKNFMD